MKKLVYKLISDTKNKQNSVSIDTLLKRYEETKDLDVPRKSKGGAMIQNKQHLIQILETLEEDNLVMYSPDDNMVVLI